MNKLRLFIVSIFFLIPMLLFSQRTVKGAVTEQITGEPLPGVNIQIKGTNQGTTTDFDGNYVLEKVNDGSVLEFSYMGYITQNIPVATNKINVVMEESAEALDEVVVIGYGTTTIKDATGSVAKISSEALKKEGVHSAEQMLVGKIAGLTVTPSGSPGGGGTVRIRESTSLYASQDPLVVIDGVPGGSLNQLNPSDIESFTVLKDASSTAIFGIRGSNGVIIITTKRAKSGELKFAYNNSFTFKNIENNADVLTADEFKNYVNTYGSEGQIALLGNENTDWQDQIFQQGNGMNHDFSMMGGSEQLYFRLGLGFNGENGVLKTSKFEKGTYSLNVGSKLFDDKLKIKASYKLTLRKYRNADTGAISSAISYDPTQPVYENNDAFGGYYQWLNPDGSRVAIGAPANPVALLEQRHDLYYSNAGIGNIKFDYELPFIEGLHANLVLGINHANGNGTIDVDNNSWAEVVSGNTVDGYVNYGYKSENSNEFREELLDFYLNYVKDVKSIDGKIDFIAGYSYQDRKDSNFSTNNLQKDPSNRVEFTDSYNPQNLQSFFGRLNVNLFGKYVLTGTYRRDGTSRFYDSNNAWISTPSAAFAWKISEEDFMKDSSTFSNLKLRLGWGVMGQQDIPPVFPGLPTYLYSNQTAQYQLGGHFYTTARPESYNPLLKWEKTTTYNAGLEFGMLADKLDGVIEVFYRKSDDLLNELPFPAGSSLSNEDWANIGNLENKGVELTLNTKVINNENTKLGFGFNATYNDIEITKLNSSDSESYAGVPVGGFSGGVGNEIQIHSVGYAPYSFYVYEQVYNNEGNPVEGVYVDRNNDGVVDSNDKYRYQRPSADITMGFRTDFSYKNFDFNMFWRGSLGNYMYNNIDSNHGFRYTMLNESFPSVINNGVQNAVDTGFENGGAERYMSDYYIQDASFVKLDNITLGYTFDNLFNLSKVRLYGSAQNVMTITDYTGNDPEVFGGIDYNIYPIPRTFVVGLNVNF